MNNNNRANNRRRGRGNNRQQGGGQPINRIDSRARGNAPQLLEKYRKLAHDAHLNGDRVTEEYYLQFADHYFRVIADTRQRQEEARLRREDRWQDGGETDREEGDDGAEYGDNDYPAPYEPVRRERPERPERAERPREDVAQEARAEEAIREEGDRSPYEPAENPFVREGRARTVKPRREERRPRRERAAPAAESDADEGAPAAFDPAALPPAIAPAPVEADEEAPAKPKRRARRPRAAADDAGDALEKIAS